MDQKIVDFLNSQRVGVLAIALADGTPHTAAMHFTYHQEVVYLITRPGSRKLQNLASGPIKASLTVGFSEQEWVTVQMDGLIEKTDVSVKDIILTKYPDDSHHIHEDSVFLKFTPQWWRYSDMKNDVYLENNKI